MKGNGEQYMIQGWYFHISLKVVHSHVSLQAPQNYCLTYGTIIGATHIYNLNIFNSLLIDMLKFSKFNQNFCTKSNFYIWMHIDICLHNFEQNLVDIWYLLNRIHAYRIITSGWSILWDSGATHHENIRENWENASMVAQVWFLCILIHTGLYKHYFYLHHLLYFPILFYSIHLLGWRLK